MSWFDISDRKLIELSWFDINERRLPPLLSWFDVSDRTGGCIWFDTSDIRLSPAVMV